MQVLGGTVAAVALMLAAGGARAADIVFSTFGPGYTYSTSGGWLVVGVPSRPSSPAAEFTPSESGELAAITVAADYLEGTNGATVSLWTESGGAPATELASYFIDLIPPPDSTPLPKHVYPHIFIGSGVDLFVGHNYFVEMAPAATDTFVGWPYSPSLAPGYVWDEGFSYPEARLPAFEVDVTPRGVPEPASWALMILGFAAMGSALRTRRRFIRYPS
jgi:hypothetical protein